MKYIDITGKTFCKLKVIERSVLRDDNAMKWVCECECGKRIITRGAALRSGHTKSCGCLTKMKRGKDGKIKSTHEMTATPTWNSWRMMRRRCYEKTLFAYCFYGGKGISVCERWRESFENFLSDMGERPDGLTLDRIDSSGNYEPSNCRWSTAKVQGNNKSSTKFITFNGETLCVNDWANRLDMTVQSLWYRLYKYHWSIEDALTTPIKSKRISECFPPS